MCKLHVLITEVCAAMSTRNSGVRNIVQVLMVCVPGSHDLITCVKVQLLKMCIPITSARAKPASP